MVGRASLTAADDMEIFLDRFGQASQVDLLVSTSSSGAPGSTAPVAASLPVHNSSQLAPPIHYAALGPLQGGPNVPVLDESTLVTRTPARGKTGSVSIHRVPAATVPGVEEYVEAGGVSGGGRDSLLYPPPREITTASYHQPRPLDSRSIKHEKPRKTIPASNNAPNLAHKVAFEEFHSQRGVRLLRGSLGPVTNVPMMLKSGYRHVYVSRSFALEHGFIPVDTTPGTYGYNGITNLGKWPVQVGSKAVPCTVMLAEDSFFPVILGRSFMEKRGVRTDPIDMTSVIFMDNGERADVEVVVVRDELGQPVPIP